VLIESMKERENLSNYCLRSVLVFIAFGIVAPRGVRRLVKIAKLSNYIHCAYVMCA